MRGLWEADLICLRPESFDVGAVAAEVYARTCRVDFEAPGFCLVNLGQSLDSVGFRQRMVDLKGAMARVHEARTGKSLSYLSAGRFDQQTTTKPHLDGGPEECFLMLGYEPSAVESELEICDYARCAFDLGLTPQELLAQHNPMFAAGYEILRPYATLLPCFSRTDFQVVCINNSSAPLGGDSPGWQGTLHAASIPVPDESLRRVVNSTLIASVEAGTAEAISAEQIEEFVHSPRVRRRGYDKTHLEDV